VEIWNRFFLTLWWKSFFKHDVPQHRKDRNLSRKRTTSLIRRLNHNGEIVDRSWLCFSSSQTCVRCFNCRLMRADTTKCAHFFIRKGKGSFHWKHALERSFLFLFFIRKGKGSFHWKHALERASIIVAYRCHDYRCHDYI